MRYEKTFTSKRGDINSKLKKWIDKHPTYIIESISGSNLKVEVIYNKKEKK